MLEIPFSAKNDLVFSNSDKLLTMFDDFVLFCVQGVTKINANVIVAILAREFDLGAVFIRHRIWRLICEGKLEVTPDWHLTKPQIRKGTLT